MAVKADPCQPLAIAGGEGALGALHDSHPTKRGQFAAVLIAPGSLHKLLEPGEVEPYARWLLDRHAHGTVLASNCGGSFLPWRRRACWRDVRRRRTGVMPRSFSAAFPMFGWIADRMVIDDGDIVTAGGLDGVDRFGAAYRRAAAWPDGDDGNRALSADRPVGHASRKIMRALRPSWRMATKRY
jgi:hypothetical protein